MTAREYAENHQVSSSTVMKWLQKGLIPGAYKVPLPAPFQGYIYQIPVDATPPATKPGPKPGKKKRSAKVKTK